MATFANQEFVGIRCKSAMQALLCNRYYAFFAMQSLQACIVTTIAATFANQAYSFGQKLDLKPNSIEAK